MTERMFGRRLKLNRFTSDSSYPTLLCFHTIVTTGRIPQSLSMLLHDEFTFQTRNVRC